MTNLYLTDVSEICDCAFNKDTLQSNHEQSSHGDNWTFLALLSEDNFKASQIKGFAKGFIFQKLFINVCDIM